MTGMATDGAAVDGAAFAEAVVFLSYFKDVQDPHQRGKVTCPPDGILLLCPLNQDRAVRHQETRPAPPLPPVQEPALGPAKPDPWDGTPAHDHLGDILAALAAQQFQSCFAAWVAAVAGVPAPVKAGAKTVRRSGQKKGAKAAIHVVAAFAARQRLVPGQVKVSDKSSEIMAIPKLPDLLAIDGAIVTIDAMGCQRDIARTVIDKTADYVLALKGLPWRRPGATRARCATTWNPFVAGQQARAFPDTRISQHTTVDHDWPGPKVVVVVESSREISGKIEPETRHYITPLAMLAVLPGPVIRSDWAVENSLHWVRDMIFRDNECRACTDHAPTNFTTIKHTALNLARRPTGKQSPRGRRKAASWDDDLLASLVTG